MLVNFCGQQVDNSKYNLSVFQVEYSGKVSRSPDFDKFVQCENPNIDGVRRKGPIVIVWYTKDGTLHAVRVGLTKILKEVKA